MFKPNYDELTFNPYETLKEMICDSRLDPNAKAIFVFLWMTCDEKDLSKHPRNRMGRLEIQLNMGYGKITTCDKYLKQLEQVGLIRIIKQRGVRNVYQLFDKPNKVKK